MHAMELTISAENTQLLDKILRIVKAEHVLIDSRAGIVFRAVSDDFSQMLVARLGESFFVECKTGNKLIAVPLQKLFVKNMENLRICSVSEKSLFEYQMEGMNYCKWVYNAEPEEYEIDFMQEGILKLDISELRATIMKIKDKNIKIRIKNGVKISAKGVVVEIDEDTADEDFAMSLDLDALKNILYFTEGFEEGVMAYSKRDEAINLIFRTCDVQLSVFLTITKE
ncbi:hypothetical protein ENBRE01_2343 [Enteropsectra breve]|nr:hypothetical protein ENBRE01_2343 [Enteropsectra breve]